ncbi:MAG: hypothetical protein KatS3mg003_0651 [Candidatus Nitrosocaldaceae archaeon]|nr:MAG: hypothetical protein KatS3mg003_0651 [Candidatus Nitrosocaldaceae archaeon]
MSYDLSKIGYKISKEDMLSFNPIITDKRVYACLDLSNYFYTIMTDSNEIIFRDELGYKLKLLKCYNCSKMILSSCITKR